ncbi:hypothetical protein BSTEL_0885 [Bifidobacterium stellenboschense]|uniref:DUF559 domain-containing protein n=2 Tax=Bifidobacterium stellenboschense TaxID=762211 RepID=A0A087E063_9BIFI|nr:hypothetical protein BSTEL_0885 [Bifidobacterium stellenboschense]
MRTTSSLCFSHTTALRLHGMAAAMNLKPGFDDRRLHACVDSADKLRRLRDVQIHLWRSPTTSSFLDDRLGCVSAADAVCQMASYTDLPSLVVAMDWLTCRNRSMRVMTHTELAERIESLGRFPGARLCRKALSYSREDTDSPQESLLRLAAEQYGLPRFMVNHVVDDLEQGKRYTVDMALPDHGIIVEYDGRYHYTMDRWETDLDKRNRLTALGMACFVATKTTLANEHNLNAFLTMIAKEIGRRRSH